MQMVSLHLQGMGLGQRRGPWQKNHLVSGASYWHWCTDLTLVRVFVFTESC